MDLRRECSLFYNFAKRPQLSCHKILLAELIQEKSRKASIIRQKPSSLLCHFLAM